MAPSRHQGAFIYTGAGKKQRADAPLEDKVCKDYSIAIQRCLARNSHQQQRCDEAVKAWKGCCERVRALEAAKAAAKAEPT